MSNLADTLSQKTAKMQRQIRQAPLNPGCYIYRDKHDKVLYIGKAKILRKRVKSYFQNYHRLDPKIQIMIDQAVSIDYLETDSEIEALILEANLIKKYKPKYNTMLVDDKNYIWIRIDRRKGSPIPKKLKKSKVPVGATYPTVQIVRKRRDDGAHYYGPYPDTRPVHRTLQRIRRLFPFCTSGKKFSRSQGKLIKVTDTRKKPCFHYNIGLCEGVCAGLESKTAYNKKINDIKQFFAGDKEKIVRRLEKEMQQAAKQHKFEKAAKLRDRLQDIRYVTKHLQIDQDIDEVQIMQRKQEQKQQALTELVEALGFSRMEVHPGFRIECYDISNIQGSNAVGAMTVMIDGKSMPRLYRKFRIRMKNEPNDFAMMQEMLFRRFYSYLVEHQRANRILIQDAQGSDIDQSKYLTKSAKKVDESFSVKPDLICIDGGKGQLSSAFKIMRNFQLDIPIVGLAKREEQVYVVEQQRWDTDMLHDSGHSLSEIEFGKVHLPRSSEASFLLQKIRDEAHRFGITYHRKLRVKQKFDPQEYS